MKQSEWNEGLNNLDSDIIENYVAQKEAYIKKIKKPTMWTRYISVAATFCLVFGVLAVSLILNRSDDEPITIPETEAETTKADTEKADNTEEESTQAEAPSETVGGVVTDDVTSEDVSESESVETTAGEKETYEETSEQTTTEETTVTPETENNEPYEIKADDYTLIKNENGCYLTFDDISKYKNSNGFIVSAYVEFASIKDFKNAVTKGLLTDSDKLIIASFPKNADGSITTCDFNNLYEPILPQGSNITNVFWESTIYSFNFKMDGVYDGYCMVLTEEDYAYFYVDQHENMLKKNTITVTKSETIDGKEIIYYKTSMASFKLERYTLQIGDKTFTIDKEFLLTGHPLLNPSDTVPNNINIFCNEDNKYYKIRIDTIYEDPTDEWLLEFGLKPYIENDHEVM